MRAKNHLLIERCIEDGVNWGFQRAYKHEDNPSKDFIADCIQECIMDEIFEWFDFSQPFDGPWPIVPQPVPEPDETRGEFLTRCMHDHALCAQYPDIEMRLEVCVGLWDGGEGGPG